MDNEQMKTKLIEIVDNQVETNEPECTKYHLHRLIEGEGFTEREAKEMIGLVFVKEMQVAMKTETDFNQDSYCLKLAKLPDCNEDTEQGKVGRNDPCPCGSGKKYKKCCG